MMHYIGFAIWTISYVFGLSYSTTDARFLVFMGLSFFSGCVITHILRDRK